MSRKTLIWICMFIGSSIGGFIPSLWSDNVFSMSAVVLTAIGGLAGIWLGYKLSR